jgi:HK97 family phage portal protein
VAELSVFGALRRAATMPPMRAKATQPLSSVDGSRGWFSLGWLGGPKSWLPETWFQRDIDVRPELALANWCVFACMTRIASDAGKVRLKLVEQDANGIWTETESPSFSPVLRKPNRYQTRQMFIERWILCKLATGNAYILKERDSRDVVVRLYVLDPHRVTPKVAPDGSVYYQLEEDSLAGVPSGLPAVPASEIIHDRFNCLFHDLVGLSPLYASALAGVHGLRIQQQSAKFFENGARPSGILTAPDGISDDTAKRLKDHWETGYSGENRGKVAVLGDGLKFTPITQNAVDSEVIKQLEMSAIMVCGTFHVPPHKIGAGPVPTNNNVEALQTQYYGDALQPLLESAEALLDEGLGLTEKKDGRQYGTYFELDDLLKMDQSTLMTTLKTGVDGAILGSNDARKRLNYKPVQGGDSPRSQQQYYALEALAARDADKPFSKPVAGAPGAPATPPAATPSEDGAAAKVFDILAEASRALTEDARSAEAERTKRMDAQAAELRAAAEAMRVEAERKEAERAALAEAAEVERAARAESAATEQASRAKAEAEAWAERMRTWEESAKERAEAETASRQGLADVAAVAADQAQAIKTVAEELRAASEATKRIDAPAVDADAVKAMSELVERSTAVRAEIETAAAAQAENARAANAAIAEHVQRLKEMSDGLQANHLAVQTQKDALDAEEAMRVLLETFSQGLEHV